MATKKTTSGKRASGEIEHLNGLDLYAKETTKKGLQPFVDKASEEIKEHEVIPSLAYTVQEAQGFKKQFDELEDSKSNFETHLHLAARIVSNLNFCLISNPQ